MDELTRNLTVAQAAKFLNVSPLTIRRELAAGKIAGLKIRGAVRIAFENLIAYEKQCAEKWAEENGRVLKNFFSRDPE